jgi:beta-glucosidase
VLEGIEEVVKSAGGKVIYSLNGEDIDHADVVIAVYGENPYAEMHGDITTYEYQPGNKIDLAILEKFNAKDIPVVSVFISGRPLWVNPELNRSKAFVAAWLPGSEGKAIADLLFKNAEGNINFDFTGKLSFSWPRTPIQQLNYHGLSSGDAGEGYEPLFAWGYGLSYQDQKDLGDQLNENGKAPSPGSTDAVTLYDGEPKIPWQLFLQEDGDNSIKIRSPRQAGLFNTVVVTEHANKSGFRSIRWTGEREAKVFLAVNSPIDFSKYRDTGVLQFTTKLDSTLSGEIILTMNCGDDCSGSIAIDKLLPAAADNWKTFTVALKCFSDQGMDLSKVMTGFAIGSANQADISFGDVTLNKNGAVNADLICTN